MAIGFFQPCPHCGTSLSYLEGVSGSTRTPRCPRCRKEIGGRAINVSEAKEQSRNGGGGGGRRTGGGYGSGSRF